MRDIRWLRVLTAQLLTVLISIAITSCATTTISEQAKTADEPQPVQEAARPVTALYYDFEDVPVPREMEIRRDKSFVFQTTDFTAGLLTFSGRVDPESLMNFFTVRLPQDGWRFLSSIKSPKSILFFQKETRFCIITIIGKTLTTDAEILVAQGLQNL